MRRPRVLPLIGAAALALPLLEILVIVEVGQWIGAGATFLLLVAGVIAGAWIIRREGERSLRQMAAGLRRGVASTEYLAGSGWRVLGGLLLIVPGFITDLVAALIMVPATRRPILAVATRLRPRRTPWVPPAPSSGDRAEPTVVRGDVL